ncbi:hypothetical protein Poli38472_000713 [Pythium oligandrum]|uniref:CW-type domain-containing protein n=1 Tax=Pythium oligandrum TaxID=41045 RepID=A0A8K1CD16_PYTOL|nr:hypothetical protein Poli38472_000713 [Pythium oligandrum]|eukprot:TMW60671.1 hypothetical protein Poli38472_000713 [Pythium oligandrum]
MWNLRLRGPKGKAAVVKIEPAESMERFCAMAAEQLAIKGKKSLTLRSGFPPQSVEFVMTDIVESKLANNDTVVVDMASASAAPAAPNTASSASSYAAPVTKGKRQEAANKAKTPARGGVHTLSGPSHRAPPKRRERGHGVRLGVSMEEQSEVIPEEEGPAPKYRRTKAIQLGSKDDVAVQLVNAVSGQSNDRAGKFFRAATKSAVEHQYEMTLANARLNAALSNKFEIQEVRNAQRAGGDDGQAAEMRVKFKESARKWKEETVALLQPVEIQAIVKYVLLSGGEGGKEMLKPFNMAQVSPRVFWSIARLYSGDVAAGLAALVPDVDWSYLDTRTRQMSEKAMQAKKNEEHYRRWKQQGTTPARASRAQPQPASTSDVIEIDMDSHDDEAKTAAPTEDIHLASAIEYAEQADKRALRNAMARAALNRVEVQARAAELDLALRDETTSASRLESARVALRKTALTPATDEEEEDVEQTTTVYCDRCNKARILSLAEGSTAQVDKAEWTCVELAAVGRSGGCDEADDELVQILGPKPAGLLLKAGIATRKDLANSTLANALEHLAHPLDATYSTTKTWLDEKIDEARLDEVNDAMIEIVGDGHLVGVLELEKLGTPADLAETPADLIVNALTKQMDWDTGDATRSVKEWQDQAKARITQQGWMGEWRTV